ncbi:MAG TPA: hypothetical protein VI358_13215 [Pseudolabrys sp.]
MDSNFSTVGRNDVIAESMIARRCSWSRMAARSCSARRRSVTSSWVETQPPPGSGSFFASTMRVTGLHIMRVTLALFNLIENLAAVGLEVPGKQAGILAVLDQLLQRTAQLHDFGREFVHFQIAAIKQHERPCASNMFRPCDMLSMALSNLLFWMRMRACRTLAMTMAAALILAKPAAWPATLDGRMDVNISAGKLAGAGIWGGSDCDKVNVYSLSVD